MNSSNDCDGIIAVIDVGSYSASICFSLSDLDRLDPSVFVLSGDVKAFLQNDYSVNFGFIICRLRKSSEDEAVQYHPFGYSHFLETDGSLFVPTKHYHIHKQGIFRRFLCSSQAPERRADWDHEVYIAGLNYGIVEGPKVVENKSPNDARSTDFSTLCLSPQNMALTWENYAPSVLRKLSENVFQLPKSLFDDSSSNKYDLQLLEIRSEFQNTDLRIKIC